MVLLKCLSCGGGHGHSMCQSDKVWHYLTPCTGEWTEWLNKDTPDGKGDLERIGKFKPVSDYVSWNIRCC